MQWVWVLWVQSSLFGIWYSVNLVTVRRADKERMDAAQFVDAITFLVSRSGYERPEPDPPDHK